jgi:UDP-glucose 4-epimerase
MKFFITGGAGYIGSHVGKLLQDNGHEVVIFDDFSNGLKRRTDSYFDQVITGNILDKDLIRRNLQNVDTVIHLAGKKAVGESVKNPNFYYENNVIGSKMVLEAMVEAGVSKIIFSSTAVVYAPNDSGVFTEEDKLKSSSPYGSNKIEVEKLIDSYCKNYEFSGLSLRYFNVLGCSDPKLSDNSVENLVPKVFKTLDLGERPVIYGDDYKTVDGTCVRDYVHIEDIAQAHLKLINHFTKSTNQIFNVGTGIGTSVRRIFNTIDRVCKINSDPVVVGRRDGDVATLIAKVDKMVLKTRWMPKKSLSEMIISAWQGWQYSTGFSK